MSSSPKWHPEGNTIGVEFLLAELDIALTFMDVAEGSQIPENVSRNHKNAHDAYDSVLRHLPKVRLSAAQSEAINGKMAVLTARLKAVGQL